MSAQLFKTRFAEATYWHETLNYIEKLQSSNYASEHYPKSLKEKLIENDIELANTAHMRLAVLGYERCTVCHTLFNHGKSCRCAISY